MDEKTKLIQQLDEARASMKAVLSRVDLKMEIYPTWKIKEIIAHITGWDDATVTALRALADRKIPSTLASRGIDSYNAQLVAERQTLSFEQVIKEWEVTREQLKSLICELPEEKVNEPFIFPWGQKGTFKEIMAILANHEEEHAKEILEIIRKKH